MAKSRILIVEDEPDHADQLKRILELRGHIVLGPAPNCSAALELIWRDRPDVAFVDTHLGSETCEAVLEECDQQHVPVVITLSEITALPEFCGDRGFVGKPVYASALDVALARLTV